MKSHIVYETDLTWNVEHAFSDQPLAFNLQPSVGSYQKIRLEMQYCHQLKLALKL